MSDPTKKTQAQQREKPEPYEGTRPIPWLVILLVAGIFIWSIAYIWFTHQTLPPEYGDRRTAADFQVAASSQSGIVDGGQIYTAQCLACHQATGAGLAGVFPPLAGSEWVTGKDSLVTQIVLHGLEGEITVEGVKYNGQMPMFKDKLNDAEIAAVISHIRSSFGNTASAVTADHVAEARAATQEQTTPWQGEAALAAYK
ncbi:cytochrome c [Alcaligenaceae bacterium]|nr:cytochrome c [Alcaligenaceae bacterium]